MDEDSELGDFNPQNDSEEQIEEEQQQPNQMGVPHLRNSRSEHDRQIRPGDVVRDLWGNGWLIAFKKKADTVREYDQQQPDVKDSLLSYEGSIGVGATEEDAVWACFYVNSNNTLAGGRSGPYDFPESRICRYAYESTDGFKGNRFQDNIQIQVLEQVADAVLRSGNENFRGAVESLLADAFDSETAQEAFELAEAGRGEDV
ncbi:hypothetical protein HHTV1_56 [Haloarcula hispanica tailed virus 1]|uniref:Uncharacterized protein n=1 Tax=Haloarcula hispanica tailed virus 1 TaxID=1273750 RepID=R4T8T5_9CAUD|nr:hypothetical protein M198_gp56 [Haloarcula hispanica tailed virus 1]AGM11310.1 hypothetical protein HHTV1_56 [Haloarcula hispanica tailed virus 1]